MIATPFLNRQGLWKAAKQRFAASSVAPVASGYERSLRPCDARLSLSETVSLSEGDRQ